MVRSMRRLAYLFATIAAAATCSAVALQFASVPFLWIGLSWAVASLVVAGFAPRTLKLPLILVACLPVAFGVGELVFPPVVDRTVSPFPFRADALLGWRLMPSQVSHAKAISGEELIYDVDYSTDAAGLRISPPDRGDQVEGCLLFFSDSFTFGEGVADDQTFPYQVGLQTAGRFKIVNLSVPGYGAEQMLAAIDRGALATDPPCKPSHVFYVALPHHIHRAARKASFSASGPTYRLSSQGTLEYLGTNPERNADSVDAASRRWLELLKGQLRKSRLLQALKNRPPQTTEDDITLYFAIVGEAFRLLHRRWPEAELHVISWDLHSFFSNGRDRFHTGLEAIQAKVHFIDEILPGYTQDPGRYGLHGLDLHPNPLAHELVASYISQRVLSPTRSASRWNPPLIDQRAAGER